MRSLVTYRSFAALTIVVIAAALLAAVWDRHGAGIAAQGTPSCVTPPSGLVSWWPAGGHTFDIQDGNHATLINGATYAAAKVGPGFSLDGVDDRVEIPDAANLKPANVTVDAWVKFDALDSPGASEPGLQYIVFKRNTHPVFFEGYTLQKIRVGGVDRIRFIVTSATGVQVFPTSTTVVAAGQFYHVVGSYDGSAVRLYVNGVLEDQRLASFPLNYGTRPVFIGSTEEPYNGRLKGVVDEVSIYNRALSASEIQAIYNAGSAGKCKPFITALDSKGGFLRADFDNPAPPTIVNLASAGFASGEQIKIRFAAQGFSFFGCGGPFASISQIGINAVFSNSTTLLSPPNQFRVPGAIDAGVDIFTGNTHFGGQPTDIPQDFLVTPTTGVVVQIPSGAAHLFIGLIDSFYQDNCGNLLVLIERVNRAPVTACHNVTVSAGASCTANASIDNGSYDPDGDSITLTQAPAEPYPLGARTVTLTVTDSNGASSSCSETVTVVDTTPPQITPLITACVTNKTVSANAACQGAIPNLTGEVSATDNCTVSSALTITQAPTAGALVGLGATPVTITVKDAAGNMSTCIATVNVVDATPPTVTSSVTKDSLWPPNHDLINVGLAVSRTDNCTPNPTVQVLVYSDEDDEDETGAGNHSPDAKDLAPGTLRLRSERKGAGDGRVYLIVVKVTDAAGNMSFACSTVVVPKSQSQADKNAVNAQAASAKAYFQANGAPPPGYFVVGDGPVIGPKQ